MKQYLVIGGSSGVGKALVHLLAEQGHRVYATYHSNTTTSNNPAISYQYLDISTDDPISLDNLPDQLDGIAYCPGSINLKPFARIKPEAFMADYQLQVVGAIKVLQATLKKLKATGNASIVLFSTVAVQNGFNFHSQVAASKGAIEGLTKALSAELAPTIRVNAIAPSLTATPLAEKLINSDQKLEANAQRHPLKRIGQPEDIAQMAAFLLSDKASWITGQIMHIDGGMSVIRQ